ncbi:MAG: gluconate 2-dehydrogenase subunit 3 family protein [Rhodanobacteraceae bacterium]
MPDRYPGYDVLAKRDGLSWNDATRQVIDARLATADAPEFCDAVQWQTLRAICDRMVPQSGRDKPVPIAALVDRKLAGDERDGYRNAHLPPLRDAWKRGLAALEAGAHARHDKAFHALSGEVQDELLRAAQHGELDASEWGGMPSAVFFKERLLHDILAAYYSHPVSWNQMGFGGPASPRGYVRMYFNRHDPWDAVEATPGKAETARKTNQHVR